MGWRCRLWFAGVLLAACASPGEAPQEGKGGAVVDGGGARVVTHTAPPDAGAASPPAQVPEVDAAVSDASFQAGGHGSPSGDVVAVAGPGGSAASPDAGARRDAPAEVGAGGGAGTGTGGAGGRGGAGGSGGRGGAGGQGGTTGAADSGGRGGESCEALEARYRVALARAVVCDFFALGPTCQQLADSSLECPGCKIAVDDTSVLADAIARWQGSGCAGRRRDCPAIVCANLHTGLCIPRGDGAVCDGTTAVMPAP